MAVEIGAKDLIVKVIPGSIANDFVRKTHYSGKVVNNSTLHFGVYIGMVLHGVMSYGSPMDKSKVISLVDTGLTPARAWNSMLELNRMAFDEVLPKNSESRALAISFRLIRKNAPHIKWVLSFSDGTASGDGTIYRATGFVLTKIQPNGTIWDMPNGERLARMTWDSAKPSQRAIIAKRVSDRTVDVTKWANMAFRELGGVVASGYQLRYIKLIDNSAKIKCNVLPFTIIDKMGAGMLRGKKITRQERHGQ